ncbi:MAG: class I SAM-dependent methyltransferase [Bacteroidetes bacterium]|nr:class I SAM-dependent methyltransferase [Bacteroidota bacterium]
MSSSEIERLADVAVQNYIATNQHEDETKLLLKHKEMFGLPFGLIANQISIRRKAENKLPLFYNTPGIVFPPSLNFEQCSSEATAKLKAKIISESFKKKLDRAADLTGGLGVDSYFLSKLFSQFDYVEPNTELLELARHNHSCLGTTSINYHQESAEEFLSHNKIHFDLVYLDPSRRNDQKQKVFKLADCTPDVASLLPKLVEASENVLIKTSPLLDIQMALTELTFVNKIIVVSVANECKELLFLAQRGFTGEPLIETYNLARHGDVLHSFLFSLSEEKSAEVVFGEPQQYLYEPNASILKAGAFRLMSSHFNLQKIHPNTHLFTSIEHIKNFPGRTFKIDEWTDAKVIGQKANVVTRNFPLSAEALRMKLKLSDGGEKYVIGFSGLKKKYVVGATRLE